MQGIIDMTKGQEATLLEELFAGDGGGAAPSKAGIGGRRKNRRAALHFRSGEAVRGIAPSD